VSAGVAGVIGGQLDVQLVRLPGNEIIVDVGAENSRGISFNAAVRDGWGVKAICDDGIRCLRPVELAGQTIDLQRMVEKAIEKRLNSYLTFKVEGGAARSSSRVSLSRFRFDLSKGNPDETQKAIEQLLKFDMRLAQALYNRDLDQAQPAVVNELDAVRASTTSTMNFGFEVLGMNIYQHAVAERQGSFVVQTPEGARAILFESLEKNGGWFQTRHGFKRTGIAAQTLDARDPQRFRSEANLFLSVGAGDEHIDDDMIVDTLDATLGSLGNKELVEALDRFGNQMERLVAERCPATTQQGAGAESGANAAVWDEACNIRLLDEPAMKALKEQGLQAAEGAIARLPDDFKAVARAAANLRLTLQSVKIHAMDHANGPKMGFRLDARLDDRALAAITSTSKADYRTALREYLTATSADRLTVGKTSDKNAVRGEVDGRWGAQMDRMAARFEERSAAYKRIADAEAALPRALANKRFVAYPIGIRFEIERNEAASLDNVVATSTSHDRALAAMALFDGLKSEAEGLSFAPLWSEHAAAFPLLAIVPKKNLELGFDVLAEPERNGFVVPLNGGGERFVKAGLRGANASAKGAEVSVISGGLFDIGGVLNGN
jgi:hypothetical protein